MSQLKAAKEVLEMENAIQQDIEQKDHPLTARELETLYLVALGLEDKAIAQLLEISIQTVKNHLSRIRTQLNAPNRTRAVVIALQYGWIDFPKESQ